MEIDRKYIYYLSTLNPDEFDKELESNSFEDIKKLKDFVKLEDENHNIVLQDDEIKIVFQEILNLYNDLIDERLLKIRLFSFELSTIESIKDSQAREEIFDKLMKIENGVSNNESFLLMNEIYTTLYEKICSIYLRKIAYAISRKDASRRGKRIKTISNYKSEKYKKLFSNLRSDIRNSIAHEDFLIDKKKPIINFYKDGSLYLSLTNIEYDEIIKNLINIQMGFDRARWELTKNFEYDLIERINIVEKYLKTRGVILKPSKDSKKSVYDYSEMIKKRLI